MTRLVACRWSLILNLSLVHSLILSFPVTALDVTRVLYPGPGYPPRHPSRVAHHLGHVTDTAEFVSRHKLARRRPAPPPGGWA